jgi:hypothetical protein
MKIHRINVIAATEAIRSIAVTLTLDKPMLVES